MDEQPGHLRGLYDSRGSSWLDRPCGRPGQADGLSVFLVVVIMVRLVLVFLLEESRLRNDSVTVRLVRESQYVGSGTNAIVTLGTLSQSTTVRIASLIAIAWLPR